MKPKIFIGSSVEGLDLAYAIQENLEFNFDITVWSQGVFNLSSYTLPDLINESKSTDYAIFVFNPDDILRIRSSEHEAVRDNVIFELGLFISALGRENVFCIKPRTGNDLHLPTDLMGLNVGTYNNKRSDDNLNAALGPFCNKVKKQIADKPKNKTIDLIELKSRRDFDRMEKIIETSTSDIFISGINLEAALITNELIITKANSGIKFKLLVMDDEAEGMEAFSKIGNVNPSVRKAKIKSNIKLLSEKFNLQINQGLIEFRKYNGILSSGCVGVDLNTDNGKLIAQHYLYSTSPDNAPILTFDQNKNSFWYSVYNDQLQKNWKDSAIIK